MALICYDKSNIRVTLRDHQYIIKNKNIMYCHIVV